MKFKLTLELDSPDFDSPRFNATLAYSLDYVAQSILPYVDGVLTPFNLSYAHGPIHTRAGTRIGRWVVVTPQPGKPEPPESGSALP